MSLLELFCAVDDFCRHLEPAWRHQQLTSGLCQRLLPVEDKLLLRKRAIVETIIDQLKNISQIEQTRHCSVTNFLVNLLCGLIAYCHQPKKLSLQQDARPRLTAA
jgi:hypothetical protein